MFRGSALRKDYLQFGACRNCRGSIRYPSKILDRKLCSYTFTRYAATEDVEER
ncbi:unnamed protein product [Blumeria hordei]|uniref:Uncharacterized protein n=1 Tax=Blumeria hordei TaxID=2867405 RepID=A0A383UQ67_BLUHO|nr:unnamed protein product [Blumeria hordei]